VYEPESPATTAPEDRTENPYVQLEGGFLAGLGVLPHRTPEARRDLTVGQTAGQDPAVPAIAGIGVPLLAFDGGVTTLGSSGATAITTSAGGTTLGAVLAPVVAFFGVLLYPQSTIVSDDDERRMLEASLAASAARGEIAISVGAVVASAPLMSKVHNEKEGDGTRGKTLEEIAEAFKDKLTPGQLKKLLEQVEKLRGLRNKSKDSRKGKK
jgi:hypothetical protein